MKFHNVGQKEFWYDEMCTILHTNGSIWNNETIPVGQVVPISAFSDHIHLKKQDRTMGQQFTGLAKSVNLNPLHYVLLMVWYRVVGDEAVMYRWFNVFIIILSLPLVFALARKLFGSNLAGWVATSLWAVNTNLQFFSHEARYVALCYVMTIGLLYAIAVAFDKNKALWWAMLSVVGGLCLYASPLFGLFIVCVPLCAQVVDRKLLTPSLLSCSGALIFYMPWMLHLAANYAQIDLSMSWHSLETFNSHDTILQIILRFVVVAQTSLFFFVAEPNPCYEMVSKIFRWDYGWMSYSQMIATIVQTSFVIFASWLLVRKTHVKTWMLLFAAFLPQLLFFIISDALRGTMAMLMERYFYIFYAGLGMVISFAFVHYLSKRNVIVFLFFIITVSMSFYNIVILDNIQCVFYDSTCAKEKTEAALLSSMKRPLLISDFHTDKMLVKAEGFLTEVNKLTSDSIFVLRASPDTRDIDKIISKGGFSDIYVSHASDAMVKNLKAQFGTRMVELPAAQTGFRAWRILSSAY